MATAVLWVALSEKCRATLGTRPWGVVLGMSCVPFDFTMTKLAENKASEKSSGF